MIAANVINGTDFTIYSDHSFDVEMVKRGRKYLYGKITSKSSTDSYLNFRLTLRKDNVVSELPNSCNSVMDIDHVFVPVACRGSRIADKLARKAFSIAEVKEWTVRPTCSYIRETFLVRCPEYRRQVDAQEACGDAYAGKLVINTKKRKTVTSTTSIVHEYFD